jgi:hypothetical protein
VLGNGQDGPADRGRGLLLPATTREGARSAGVVNGAAVERVREALVEHGCAPRGSNLKLRARCPVHGSHGPTLAISQGRAGAIVKCHAQCETPDILAAIGLSWPDLYDEPRDGGHWPVRVTPRKPAPYEEVGRVLARAAVICATREALQDTARFRPARTPDERVEHAEWACEEEARHHYWVTLARWAALACDRGYVRQAYRDAEAWQEHRGPRPSWEQFMVLLFRKQDLERA